jgi:hypothetical protein
MFMGIVSVANAQQEGTRVTVDNFVRAETDHMIRLGMKAQGLEVGKIVHARESITPKTQTVIRSNQDTLYSSVILDLSKPVTVTLPEIGGRYMSMHVISQDHYMFVKSEPRINELTGESVGTRFASVIIRTFVDVNDPDDIAKAHAAQDASQVSGGGDGPFEAPYWDFDNLTVIRKALNDIAALGFDSSYAYGTKTQTRPGDYLVGAAADRPEDVPAENWLPLNRGDYGIDVILRLYVRELEKFKTWTPPKAEMGEISVLNLMSYKVCYSCSIP